MNFLKIAAASAGLFLLGSVSSAIAGNIKLSYTLYFNNTTSYALTAKTSDGHTVSIPKNSSSTYISGTDTSSSGNSKTYTGTIYYSNASACSATYMVVNTNNPITLTIKQTGNNKTPTFSCSAYNKNLGQ